MDDLLDDATDVAVTLGIVKAAELSSTLAVVGVRLNRGCSCVSTRMAPKRSSDADAYLEDRTGRTLTLSANAATHICPAQVTG